MQKQIDANAVVSLEQTNLVRYTKDTSKETLYMFFTSTGNFIAAPEGDHSHVHRHAPTRHTHPHVPDVHHIHRH